MIDCVWKWQANVSSLQYCYFETLANTKKWLKFYILFYIFLLLLMFFVVRLTKFSTAALLTLGLNMSLSRGAILCIVGCLAASLASTHEKPVVPSIPSCDKKKKMFPDIAKYPFWGRIVQHWEPLDYCKVENFRSVGYWIIKKKKMGYSRQLFKKWIP